MQFLSVRNQRRIAFRASDQKSKNMMGLNGWLNGLMFVAIAMNTDAAQGDLSAGLKLFEEKIRPALSSHCYKCHSAQANKIKGGLALDRREAILKGGDSGPALVPERPEESLLIKAIRRVNEDLAMPPEEKLPDAVISAFEQWVRLGALMPDLPSLASPAPEIPTTAWWDTISEGDLAPPDRPVPDVIDFYVGLRLQKANLEAAPEADDLSLIRRLSLDLIGRIPTAAEVLEYEQSRELNKKEQWIERLLNSPEFTRHQVTEFEWLLMDGSGTNLRGYLTRALGENKGWDRIFRDLILADARREDAKGAESFIKTRVRDLDRLVNDVSVRFFGVNISCAQCHDHPLVPSWKQDHYFGMKSFFSRTFEAGDFVGEREYGFVSFKNTAGESKQAQLMFLTGAPIEEPNAPEWTDDQKKQEKQQLEELKKKKLPPPPPRFSRRAVLVEAGLKPGQDGFIARAIVNQLWNRLFGCGLVMPVDQMHGQNVPSHPELLQWLVRDLVRHDYDVKRLIHGLVSSGTYARRSQWEGEKEPDPRLFAVAVPRALTPEQYGISLVVATTAPHFVEQARARGDWPALLDKIVKESQSWAAYFERQPENFQTGMDEVLLLSNNDRVQSQLLGESEDRLVKELGALQNPAEIVHRAVWNVLGRAPRPLELRVFDDYLARRVDRRTEAIRQVVWALMASAEFRFNH